MSMPVTSPQFHAKARAALADADLQASLHKAEVGFIARRRTAADKLPEFDALRDAARDIKDHTLDHLDVYLATYEANATAQGAVVHWAATAEDARDIILKLCRQVDARTVTKGKSMIAEEVGLNAYLEQNGVTPIETDLGEYIIQIRGEYPSHIIAPAVHLTKDQVEADFRRVHAHLPADRNLDDPATLLAEAREVLRERFLAADVGITGANFLVAETGSSVVVTNEGNGDLTQTLPKMHIVLASIEKVVPTLEDVTTLLRVLARSATGQDQGVYTTFSTGPRRPDDPDGPPAYHVVLLDNGRSAMLGTPFQPMLRCIRCGACMNHCPVYHAVGGHTYGWVYSGPMGAVLTPSLVGLEQTAALPNASTLCGRCQDVCPVRIPLPAMLRRLRERQVDKGMVPPMQRNALAAWAWLAGHPRLYRLATAIAVRMLALVGGRRGRFRWLPFAGGWTGARELAAPAGTTFQSAWKRRPRADAGRAAR